MTYHLLQLCVVEKKRINKWYKKLFRSQLSAAVLISLIIHTRSARAWGHEWDSGREWQRHAR